MSITKAIEIEEARLKREGGVLTIDVGLGVGTVPGEAFGGERRGQAEQQQATGEQDVALQDMEGAG